MYSYRNVHSMLTTIRIPVFTNVRNYVHFAVYKMTAHSKNSIPLGSMATEVYSFTQHLRNVVEKAVAKLGYTNIKVKFDEDALQGGFLGEIHKLTVEGRRGDQDGKLHLVAKCLTSNELRRKNVPLEFFCSIETEMYKEVFPKINQLQYDGGIKQKFKIPKCYSVGNERFKEIILMEDLSKQGYEMSRIGISLDYEHSVLLIVEAARFHALCMVYRLRQANNFETLIKNLPNFSDTNFKMFLDGGIKYATDNIHSDTFETVMNRYNEFNSWNKFTFQTDGKNYKNAVILHGDLWANNCLFKYKESTPEDIMLIDWQGCRYASPVIDLFFALFIAVDEKIRKEMFQDLINLYYKAISDYIQDFGENVAELYPKIDFRDDLKTYSYAGMSFALFMLPIFTSNHDEVEAKMNDVATAENLVLGGAVPSPLYISRMKQMAEDIITHALDELW